MYLKVAGPNAIAGNDPESVFEVTPVQARTSDGEMLNVEALVAGGAVEIVGGPATAEMPAASASRADWDSYAEAQGLNPADYSSKEELQAALGSEG